MAEAWSLQRPQANDDERGGEWEGLLGPIGARCDTPAHYTILHCRV